MNPFELLFPDGRPAGVFACGKCGTIRSWNTTTAKPANVSDEDNAKQNEHLIKLATQCCEPAMCRTCGKPTGSKYTPLICDPCSRIEEGKRETLRFEKATHLTPADYDGPFFAPNSGQFFMSIEDVDEHYADEPEWVRPQYLWCAVPVTREPDFEGDLRDMMHDEYGEDADEDINEVAWEELRAFEKEWWRKNRPQSWNVDHKRCVVLEPAEAS